MPESGVLKAVLAALYVLCLLRAALGVWRPGRARQVAAAEMIMRRTGLRRLALGGGLAALLAALSGG